MERARTATVVESSRELNAKERIKLKDEKNHMPLKVVTKPDSATPCIEIDVKGYALIKVHNERAKNNKDYEILVVEDKSGVTYSTSSNSMKEAFMDIWTEMKESCEDDSFLEDFKINVYSLPSKNNENGFITCSLI